MGLVTGILAVPGRVMGHAGAFAVLEEEKAAEKTRLLEDAGVVMTDHPAKFGTVMKELLEANSALTSNKTWLKAPDTHSGTLDTKTYRDQPFGACQNKQSHPQTRSLHRYAKRPQHTINQAVRRERRNISFKGHEALTLLSNVGIPVNPSLKSTKEHITTTIEVDRASHQLCLQTTKSSPSKNGDEREGALYFNVADSSSSLANCIHRLSEDLHLQPDFQDTFHSTIDSLIRLFTEKEASSFMLQLVIDDSQHFTVQSAILSFDDAAYRSAGRHKDIQALRSVEDEIPEEVEAEKDGIVYIKYVVYHSPSPILPKATHHKSHTNTNPKLTTDSPATAPSAPLVFPHSFIPSLIPPPLSPPTQNSTNPLLPPIVNGAGLAMNTIDALMQRGGQCANFLDTGGKATRATVRASLGAILRDARVRAVFVNVFGGLTRCDMIAEGVLLAYRELDVGVPVVVRLRGTGEGVGQRMVRMLCLRRVEGRCWEGASVGNGADECGRLRRAGCRCWRSTTLRRRRRR